MSDLQEQVDAFDFWYHKIELPGGVVTPGWAPHRAEAYGIPANLEGKRVLDVGAWDGYWTFEALKRGASEVVSIDDFSDQIGKNVKRHAWDTFDLCRDALGYSEGKCSRHNMSVYDLTPELFGTFDVVFFFGTLYHLRYPLLGLDKLSAVCTGNIFVESAILDDFSPFKGGLNLGYPGNQMVMEFYPGTSYGDNESNWWVPTLYCLGNMIAEAGFSNVMTWKLTDNPSELRFCRGFASGSKQLVSPFRS